MSSYSITYIDELLHGKLSEWAEADQNDKIPSESSDSEKASRTISSATPAF